MKLKTKSLLTAAMLAAGLFAGGGAAPATADTTAPGFPASDVSILATTSASGNHSCPSGKQVTLIVTINTAGYVLFQEKIGTRWFRSGGENSTGTAVHTYSKNSVTWQVSSTDIASVQEACT